MTEAVIPSAPSAGTSSWFVVLMPGGDGSTAHFKSLIAFLTALGMSCLAIDIGRDFTDVADVAELASRVALRILERRNSQQGIAMIGMSAGPAIVQALAAQLREVAGMSLDAVVLLDPIYRGMEVEDEDSATHMLALLIGPALISAGQGCTYRTIRETTTAGSCEYAAAETSHVPPRIIRRSAKHVHTSSIIDGWLADGATFIGTYTSQLQAYIDETYAPVTKEDYEQLSLVNSSVLRSLRLRGIYWCDTPLRLPSMFVLLAEGTTIAPASNLSLHNVTRFSALVMLDHVTLSAIVGGTYDASSLPAAPGYPTWSRGYQAVTILGGPGKNAIRGVRALANNSDAAVGVNGSPHAAVSDSDVGGAAAHGMLTGRCIWLLGTSSALIHHNRVRNCTKHSLDFDAYTSGSAAYSNVLEDHGEEGIFVEETASGNFVFNNTVRGAARGIAVYSNAVGPVANNFIIGNILVGNGAGLSSGGVGHDPDKHSLRNIFASNFLQDNSEYEIDPIHGPISSAVSGDYWTGNEVIGGGVEYRKLPYNYTSVTIFEPLR